MTTDFHFLPFQNLTPMNLHSLIAACIAMLVAGASMQLLAQGAAEQRVEGRWQIIEGLYDGRQYGGEVQIDPLGMQKILRWTVQDAAFSGIGFYQNDALYVGWGTGPSYGLVLYTIRADGSLDGTWIYAGSDEVPGTEHAVRGSLDEAESVYMVSGVNPGRGSHYSGTMKVWRDGDLYHLRWEVGTGAYDGIGLRVGNRLVVGWGAGADFGVIAYAVEDGRLLGRVARAGGSEIGTEILGREMPATPGR